MGIDLKKPDGASLVTIQSVYLYDDVSIIPQGSHIPNILVTVAT